MRRLLLAWVSLTNGWFIFTLAKAILPALTSLGLGQAVAAAMRPSIAWNIFQLVVLVAGIALEFRKARTAFIPNVGFYVMMFFWSIGSVTADLLGWLDTSGMALRFLLSLGLPCLGIAVINGLLYAYVSREAAADRDA